MCYADKNKDKWSFVRIYLSWKNNWNTLLKCYDQVGVESQRVFMWDFISGESGLVNQGVVIRIGRILVQTPLGTWPGLGTEPCYEAPGDLRVKYVKTLWLTPGGWGFPLDNGPKLAVGQPNSSYIKLNSVFGQSLITVCMKYPEMKLIAVVISLRSFWLK